MLFMDQSMNIQFMKNFGYMKMERYRFLSVSQCMYERQDSVGKVAFFTGAN